MNVEIVLFDASLRLETLADFVVGVTCCWYRDAGFAMRWPTHEMFGDLRMNSSAEDAAPSWANAVFVCAWRFGGNALDHGLFETAKNVGDRFVNGGDARNGDRTRNNTHGIGGVTGVFGLPQLMP